MDGGYGLPVLRCKQCNKPFDKVSSWRRHGYYCRSRIDGIVVRDRSCIACATSKVKCDHKRPGCSRCTARNAPCVYPTSKPRKPKSEDAAGIASIQISDSSPVPTWSGPELQTQSDKNDSISAVQAPMFDWNALDSDLATLFSPEMNYETSQYTPAKSPLFLNQFLDDLSFSARGLQHLVPQSQMQIPATPSLSVGTMTRRPILKNSNNGVAGLILSTLRSYPLMIRRKTPAPFVHPTLISSEVGSVHMDPLHNCISLLQMTADGLPGSQELFWKNVRLECERFCVEHQNMSEWELLKALQALSLYIFVRLGEHESKHAENDQQLVIAVIVVAQRLNTMSPPEPAPHDLQQNWETWIYTESARRICIIYQVVNMLVYFEPAMMCDGRSGILLAPLPAKRQLWEAGNAETWRNEGNKAANEQKRYGMTATGELVDMDEDHPKRSDKELVAARGSSRSTLNWVEWASGMDAFGGLIMLAASLVAH